MEPVKENKTNISVYMWFEGTYSWSQAWESNEFALLCVYNIIVFTMRIQYNGTSKIFLCCIIILFIILLFTTSQVAYVLNSVTNILQYYWQIFCVTYKI